MKKLEKRLPDSNGSTWFMKTKFNFWITNVFLTVVMSLLLNGGIFAESTKVKTLDTQSLGAIKLMDKNFVAFLKAENSIDSHPFGKHLGLDHTISGQVKGKR